MLSFLCDVPELNQIGFQDPASPIMEEIIHFHDYILFISIFIISLVLWLIVRLSYGRINHIIPHRYFTHGSSLEIIWTLLPAVVLVSIAFPSFRLLYLIDEVIDPVITIKAIGRQWYWSYEYSDYLINGETLSFDSYMIPEEDLTLGSFRLLEVDNRLVLPINTHVRVIITAADVLHSWAVPSLGIKTDAVPGRLNQTSFVIKRAGLFYGQCSELCGFGHGFMPIVIQAVPHNTYINWIHNFKSYATTSLNTGLLLLKTDHAIIFINPRKGQS